MGIFACATWAGNTCVWTGAAGDGKWSTAENWAEGTAPASGNDDRLVFISDAAPLVVSNDVADISVGYIVTSNLNADASIAVTIGGEAFTLAGVNGTTRLDCYCATTFDTPIVFDCNLKAMFRATADFTFNHDLTLNGSGTTRLGGGGTDSNTAIKPNVYFRGQIYGPNAQIDAVNEVNNAHQYYYHHGPVVLRQYDAGMEYRNCLSHFYAAGNDIKTLRAVGYGRVSFNAANAFAADNKLVQVSTKYAKSIGGQMTLNADQTFAGLTVDASNGSMRTGVYGTKTLTLVTDEDLELPYWSINDSASLRWAPTANCSLTLSTATNATSGGIFVDRGTLKIGTSSLFADLTRLELGPNTGLEIASGAEDCFGTSPKVALRMRASTGVTLNADIRVKSVSVDGVVLAAGEYSAAKGTSWIIGGTGTLTVEEGNTTSWSTVGDGDWNVAANWTAGAPALTMSTYLTRYGDRTVSVNTTPAASVGAFTMDNLDGTTVLDVNAPLTFKGGAVAIGEGAEVRVNEGGEWSQDFTGAATTASAENFTLRDGAKFVVDGGRVNLTNTVGRISIGGSDGSAGTVEIKRGAVSVARKSGDGILLHENGLFRMTGGQFAYNAGGNFSQFGGTFDISGDACVESSATGFYTVFRTGTLRISGNAEFANTGGEATRWYFTPNNAGETCRIELSESGFLNVYNDSIRLNNGTADGKTLVSMRGQSRFLAANGFYVGSGGGAEGELDVYDQAYVEQGRVGYGMDFGTGGSAAKPAKGILRMHGGGVYAKRSSATHDKMQGVIFGRGLGDYSVGPVARGVFEMTGGALTNDLNGVMAFGAGMAEGTGTQNGGFVYQKSSLPVLFGFRGGMGTYALSGGKFLANGNVFVGGAQTNVIDLFLGDLADRPGTGRLAISGGIFETAKSLYVSAGGYGTLEVTGTNGVVKVGGSLYLTNSMDVVAGQLAPAKLKFTASPDGCRAIEVVQKLQIAADAELTVDVTAYTRKVSFPLVTCAAVEGAFNPEKVVIVSDKPGKFAVRQDTTGLRLLVQNGTTLLFR